MTSSHLNRRRHVRVPLQAEYRLFLDGTEHIGETGNISLSGAFLLRPDPEILPAAISKIGHLNIKFLDEFLSFNCEIIYVVAESDTLPVGVGVVFCDADDDETKLSILNLALIPDE